MATIGAIAWKGFVVFLTRPRIPGHQRHRQAEAGEDLEEETVREQVGQQDDQRGADEGAPQALPPAQHHAEEQDDHQFVGEGSGAAGTGS